MWKSNRNFFNAMVSIIFIGKGGYFAKVAIQSYKKRVAVL